MTVESDDLLGSAPDRARGALLLIDVLNDLEFEGGAELLEQALPMAERIAALKQRARASGIPALYVNDNFGRWRSDVRGLVDHCLTDGVRGRPVVERLLPEPEDYFVLKPKHSAFFSTTLETLLRHLGTERLILTGMAADACILITAAEAHMRDYDLWVPGDCVAAQRPEWRDHALELMARGFDADLASSDRIDLERVAGRKERRVS